MEQVLNDLADAVIADHYKGPLGREKREDIEANLNDLRSRVIDGDRLLRRMLWLRHGCPITALYGDDGEMSCGRCMIDFKRATPEDISKAFKSASLRKLRAILDEAGNIPQWAIKTNKAAMEKVRGNNV